MLSASYIDTDGGPCGLILDEARGRLYVMTRFNNSLAVIDLASGARLQRVALFNPEPQGVVDGRPFLYDAFNTSGNGEASCASCHVFADFDSLAWELGDPDGVVTTNTLPPAALNIAIATSFHPLF